MNLDSPIGIVRDSKIQSSAFLRSASFAPLSHFSGWVFVFCFVLLPLFLSFLSQIPSQQYFILRGFSLGKYISWLLGAFPCPTRSLDNFSGVLPYSFLRWNLGHPFPFRVLAWISSTELSTLTVVLGHISHCWLNTQVFLLSGHQTSLSFFSANSYTAANTKCDLPLLVSWLTYLYFGFLGL